MSDRTEPVARTSAASDLNLAVIAAKSAVESAVQQPMEGVAQLVGLHAPRIVDKPPTYDFNTPEWYASTVGHGAGFMLPFLATSKVTATFVKEAGVGKAMLDGAVSGFAFTPSGEGQSGLSARAREAFTSSVMFGTQHALAEGLSAFALKSAPTISRLGINAISGTVGGVTSLETTSILTGNGLVTDKQALIENAVSSAVTGFALDAARLASLKPHATTFDTVESRKPMADAETGSLPNKIAKDVKQLPDGRIFYTVGDGDKSKLHVWTPFGMRNSVTGYLSAKTGDFGHQIWQRHEPQGFYTRLGSLDTNELHNLYATEKGIKEAPQLTPEVEDRLQARLPMRLEPDVLARARILPTEDGSAYGVTEIKVEVVPKADAPRGMSKTDFDNNWIKTEKVPARVYKILSAEGAMQLAQMQDKSPQEAYRALHDKAVSVVVPEEYAQKLDKIRVLRLTATQDPTIAQNPERVLAARLELFNSPLRDRFLPEHWGQFLDMVPTPNLINQLQLIEHDSPNKSIADAQSKTGIVRFFGDHNSVQEHVRRTLLHEWSHRVQDSQPSLKRAFDAVVPISDYQAREYAGKNENENWAVHFAEMLMDPNPELFMTLAQRTPIRVAILAEALKRELAKAPESFHNKEEMQARVAYVDEKVIPEAKNYLRGTLIASGDVKKLRAGLAFVEHLNGSEEDRAFRDKLFDLSDLKGRAKATLDAVGFGKEWKPDMAARGLLRMDTVRKLDPSRYDNQMQAIGNRANAKLTATISADLNSGEPPRVTGAINLLKSLDGSDLFKRIVVPEDLLAAINATTDAESARQVLKLFEDSVNVVTVRGVINGMLKEQGLKREIAAAWALSDGDNKNLWQNVQTLQEQLKSGDSSAFTQPVINVLNDRLDDYVNEISSNRQKVISAIADRTRARAVLFQDLVATKPDLMQDPLMQSRSQRVKAFLDLMDRTRPKR
jgi:hypothetical protein